MLPSNPNQPTCMQGCRSIMVASTSGRPSCTTYMNGLSSNPCRPYCNASQISLTTSIYTTNYIYHTHTRLTALCYNKLCCNSEFTSAILLALPTWHAEQVWNDHLYMLNTYPCWTNNWVCLCHGVYKSSLTNFQKISKTHFLHYRRFYVTSHTISKCRWSL